MQPVRPGKSGRKELNFQVDTGCTHNLLSKTVFARLPAQERQKMVYEETVVTKADGSGLHIYSSIGLSGRLKNMPFEARFLVCCWAVRRDRARAPSDNPLDC